MSSRTVYRASRFWSTIYFPLATGTWIPAQMEIGENGVTITKKALFGLMGNDEHITYDKIASVQVQDRLFYANIIIEATGENEYSLQRVPRDQAGQAVEEIRRRVSASA